MKGTANMKIRMLFSGLLTICLLSLMANAGPLKVYEVSATTGTNAAQVVTAPLPVEPGRIESVYVDMVTAGSTSAVNLAITPADSTLASESVLALASVTADAVYHVLVPASVSSGSASTLLQTRYVVPQGYSLTLSLTNATVTARVYRAVVTMELSDK